MPVMAWQDHGRQPPSVCDRVTPGKLNCIGIALPRLSAAAARSWVRDWSMFAVLITTSVNPFGETNPPCTSHLHES